MKPRPTSITVIGWLLIVVAAISLATSHISLNMPVARELMSRSALPIPLQFALHYLGVAVTLICGVGLLKRQNWARFLYPIFSVFGLAVSLITSPFKIAMLPSVVFIAVVTFFFFRPAANDFFAPREGSHDAQGP